MVLTGLGIYQIDWLRAGEDVSLIPSDTAVYVIKTLLTVALACLLLSLTRLLARGREATHRTSSAELFLRLEEDDPADRRDAEELSGQGVSRGGGPV